MAVSRADISRKKRLSFRHFFFARTEIAVTRLIVLCKKADLQTKLAIPTLDEGFLFGMCTLPFFSAKTKVLCWVFPLPPVLVCCTFMSASAPNVNSTDLVHIFLIVFVLIRFCF